MKTRSGYVSNSSSSSFVILAKDEDIKQSLSVLPAKTKKFIKNEILINGKKVIVGKATYKLYFGTYYTDNWCEYMSQDGTSSLTEFDSEEEIWSELKTFERLVKPICMIEEY